MCFVRISEQTATFALQSIKTLVFITEVESVYSALRTESINTVRVKGLIQEDKRGESICRCLSGAHLQISYDATHTTVVFYDCDRLTHLHIHSTTFLLSSCRMPPYSPWY
jgi:hypothetical protein